MPTEDITILNNVSRLLSDCNSERKEHEARMKQNPTDYNLFSIMGYSDEELLHSSMIGSLLDPKGNHHQGPFFLEMFIQYFGIDSFDTESAEVILEKSIGLLRDSLEEGGRIDIYISDKDGNKIIIENKINAGDQPKQLLRYHNFAGTSKIPIFYLTPDGRDASEESRGSLVEGIDYKKVTYQKDIIGWLNLCLGAPTVPPYMKGCIANYKSFVKKLTRNSTVNIMKESIKTKVIENISSAIEIASVLNDAKADTIYKLFTSIASELEVKGLKPHFCQRWGCNNTIDTDNLRSMIQKYVQRASDSNKRFGISVSLGEYSCQNYYLNMMVNENLFYDISSDSKIKTDLIKIGDMPENTSEQSKDERTWRELAVDAPDKDYRLFWRYPKAKDYKINVINFGKDLIDYAENKNNLATVIAEDFLTNYVSVQNVLNRLIQLP